MSRPFKEFRTELKARQEEHRQKEAAKRAKQQERNNYINSLKVGQRVKYSRLVNAYTKEPFIEHGFFISDTGSEYIWVAKTKADALNGYGATILKSSVII